MRFLSRPLLRGLPFLGCALLVLNGCAARPDEGAEPEPEPEMLYFEPIGEGHYARRADTVRVAIRDAETWAAYREDLRPRAPFKEVDFTQAMVLLVVLQAPSGGYSIEFESVEKVDSTILASYVLNRPGHDCVTVMALTQPFQAVMVRRAEGEVQFEQRVESLSCELR